MARELAKKGVTGKLYPRRTDMRKEEDILAAFAWADSELGGADVLINNAGTSFCGYHSGKDPENKNDHQQIITVILKTKRKNDFSELVGPSVNCWFITWAWLFATSRQTRLQ